MDKWIGGCFDGLLVKCLVVGWMDVWTDIYMDIQTDGLSVKVLYSLLEESIRVEIGKQILPILVSPMVSGRHVTWSIAINV